MQSWCHRRATRRVSKLEGWQGGKFECGLVSCVVKSSETSLVVYSSASSFLLKEKHVGNVPANDQLINC